MIRLLGSSLMVPLLCTHHRMYDVQAKSRSKLTNLTWYVELKQHRFSGEYECMVIGNGQINGVALKLSPFLPLLSSVNLCNPHSCPDFNMPFVELTAFQQAQALHFLCLRGLPSWHFFTSYQLPGCFAPKTVAIWHHMHIPLITTLVNSR